MITKITVRPKPDTAGVTLHTVLAIVVVMSVVTSIRGSSPWSDRFPRRGSVRF